MKELMDELMYIWVDGWRDEWMDGRLIGLVNEGMDG